MTTAAKGSPPTRKDGPERRGLAHLTTNCSVTLRLAAMPNTPSQVQAERECGSKTSQAEAGNKAVVTAKVNEAMPARPRSANPAPGQIQDRTIAFRRSDAVEDVAASEGFSVDITATSHNGSESPSR
jgi:hypothetical protein